MQNKYERTLDELQQLTANEALAREFDPDYIGPSPKTRREMEMLRGAERIAALEMNCRELPPDADDGPKISAAERARKDEARKHVVNWSKLDRA